MTTGREPGSSRVSTTLRHGTPGRQDAALFEVPAGLTAAAPAGDHPVVHVMNEVATDVGKGVKAEVKRELLGGALGVLRRRGGE